MKKEWRKYLKSLLTIIEKNTANLKKSMAVFLFIDTFAQM